MVAPGEETSLTLHSRLPVEVRALDPWSGRYLRVEGGHRLHYLDVGKGEPLLFVHGNPTWSFLWRHAIAGLSEQYRCVAVDHLGCGLSDKPPGQPYLLRDRIDHLVHLVEALDLHDITLVVHDWGGCIGYGAALKMPDRFKRFVVTNTCVFLNQLPASIRFSRTPLGRFVVKRFNAFLRIALRSGTVKPVTGAARTGFLFPYQSAADREAIVAFVKDIPLEPGHPSLKLVEAIDRGVRSTFASSPHLVLWGMKDFVFDQTYLQGFVERLPSAEFHRYEDAGHWIQEDLGDALVPPIRDFLAAHPLR